MYRDEVFLELERESSELLLQRSRWILEISCGYLNAMSQAFERVRGERKEIREASDRDEIFSNPFRSVPVSPTAINLL